MNQYNSTPDLLPSSPTRKDHDELEDDLNPQSIFKVAANALAQLYKQATSTDQASFKLGFDKALDEVSQSVNALQNHPLSVISNGRTYVSLDLIQQLITAHRHNAHQACQTYQNNHLELLDNPFGTQKTHTCGRVSPLTTMDLGSHAANASSSSSSSSLQLKSVGLPWSLDGEPFRKRPREF